MAFVFDTLLTNKCYLKEIMIIRMQMLCFKSITTAVKSFIKIFLIESIDRYFYL